MLANYEVKLVDGKLTVTKAPLSVKADNKTKVYGDQNPKLTGVLTGVKNGDEVTKSFSTTVTEKTGVGEYAIAAHANGEAAVLANYDIELVDGTLEVTKAPLSVKANDASRKYGDADPALSGVITGVKNNDVVSATYSSPATPASNVGTYPIVPQVVGTTAVLANYETPASTNGTLTVGKAPLSVKADDRSKVYGDENPVLTGTIIGVKNDDSVTERFSTTVDQKTGVGVHEIAATTGEAAVRQLPGRARRRQADDHQGAARGRGERRLARVRRPEPRLHGRDHRHQERRRREREVLDGCRREERCGRLRDRCGDRRDGEVMANDQAPERTNGTLTVTKAPLSVNADDKSKVYGDANPELTGTITGVKNDDAVTKGFSTTVALKTGVGEHKIAAHANADEAVLANYLVELIDGTLKITKAPLSVKADDKTKVYGDVTPALTGELTGVKNGDQLTASFSTDADEKSGVGGHKILAHVNGTDAVLANYEVKLVDGTLTVTQALLSVKADDKTKVYGDANPVLTGVLTGVKNGDQVSASFSTAADEKTGVGGHRISAHVNGTDAVLANYEVKLVDGKLTVTKAPLSVKADNKTKVYGDQNPKLTGVLTGVKNGDEVTKSFSTTVTEKTGVGEYAIAAHANGEAAVLANYDIELVDGTLEVTKAPLSVKANDASRKYGEANPGFTGVIAGIKNGDDVKAEYSSDAKKVTGVGTYPIAARIVATDAVLANYEEPVRHTGTLTITKAPLSVKADDKTKVYGDASPPLTGAITGVQNGDPVTASFSTNANEKSSVGEHKIVARVDGTEADLRNYDVELIAGWLTVTKAPLSMKANDATRVLGAENPVFIGVISGVKRRRRDGELLDAGDFDEPCRRVPDRAESRGDGRGAGQLPGRGAHERHADDRVRLGRLPPADQRHRAPDRRQ